MMFFNHKNLRLIFFVKKRLITLKNFWFLESEYQSLLERNDIVTREIECQKSYFFFPMRPFALELKCWMIFFINVSPMGIREVWATLAKLRLSLVETHSLLKLKRKLLTKYSYLAFSYYAHTIRSLDILKVDIIVDSLRSMSLN